MSIEDKNIIDSIGTDLDRNKVVLAISDNLNWENEYDHLIMLQDKINKYLGFIESGEIMKSYPQAAGKEFEIKIYAKYNFSKKAKEFLDTAQKYIRDAGFTLSYEAFEK